MSGNKAEKLAALTENQSNILQRFYEHWKNSNVYWKVGSALLGSILFFGASYGIYFRRNYKALHALPGYSHSELDVKKVIELTDEKIRDSDGKVSKSEEGHHWRELQVRVINLDNALLEQTELLEEYKPHIVDVTKWGPPLRMDCNFRQYWRFEQELAQAIGADVDTVDLENKGPLISFYGSNDFHHLTLALFRRIRQPCNFVIFDNHPDYVEFYPGLHCGCWLNHVIQLPTVQQAFHFGGYSGEFEDPWLRWETPWKHMKEGKLAVFPAYEKFEGMKWNEVPQIPLRPNWHRALSKDRVKKLLAPYAEVLAKYPLYITLDKDVMTRDYCLQNWNSGVLIRTEVFTVIEVLIEMSGGRLLAMDITGDFSKVKTQGVYRSYLHSHQHSDTENDIDPETASRLNQETNKLLLKHLHSVINNVATTSN
jgi:hypothetical protein